MATKDITDIQVILAFIESRKPNIIGKYPYDFLMEETGQPFKVCYRAMERAEGRGYIDCGVSLRTGWVTDKGYEYLKQNNIKQ